MFDSFTKLRRTGAAAAMLGVASLLFAGCTTTSSQSTATAAEKKQELDAAANATLSKLYESSSQARQLVEQARGVLVFPAVLSASFIVGAQHGSGVLRVQGADSGTTASPAGPSACRPAPVHGHGDPVHDGRRPGESPQEQRLDGGGGCDGRGGQRGRQRQYRYEYGAAAHRRLRAEQRRPHGRRIGRRQQDLAAAAAIPRRGKIAYSGRPLGAPAASAGCSLPTIPSPFPKAAWEAGPRSWHRRRRGCAATGGGWGGRPAAQACRGRSSRSG